jgi:hypothetical protein
MAPETSHVSGLNLTFPTRRPGYVFVSRVDTRGARFPRIALRFDD